MRCPSSQPESTPPTTVSCSLCSEDATLHFDWSATATHFTGQILLCHQYNNPINITLYPDSTHLCIEPLPIMNNIFFADVKTEGSSGEEDSDDDEGGPNNVEVS